MFEKRLVLDTCALLWLVSGNGRLSEKALKAIERASIVYVSSITAWEIGLKYARQELSLPMEAEEWFDSVLERHSLTSVPLDASIAFRANRLPFHHRDPADRFIIATALELSSAIVTTDSLFEQYGVKIIS